MESIASSSINRHVEIVVAVVEEDEKINSNQLGNDQSNKKSTDPVQENMEEDLDSSKGSSQEDEDLDLWEVSSLEVEDLDLLEVSSLEDEDGDDSSDGCSQECGEY
ncbi:hypothetical protein P7K49_039197 [Saguinus oedipus]|uniref:Uncharacterized protein n=1 Tax=Saguinus oedipus TaxID=9490 RepID=A0ABQ9TGX5_SAGOE|nr:hypothetical protein P7K49_039197 [Saguinus oedipus]